MDLVITVCAFLLLIGVVITIHESGHFLMAQIGNIKILEFSIGFGKQIFSKKLGKDQTLFTLRILPLGGFVKPLEKSALSDKDWESLSELDKKRTLTNASRTKKALMVAGGPVFNFILAFVLYIFISSVIGTSLVPARIAEITPTSLFAKAGVNEGETIIEINSQKIKNLNDAFSLLANNAIKGNDISLKTDKNLYKIEFSKLDLKKMDDNISKLMGLYFASAPGQIIVKQTNDKSPAKNAGLLPEDIIKKVNNIEINDLGKFIRLLSGSAEKTVQMEIMRKDTPIILTITPEAKEEKGNVVGKIGASFKTVQVSVQPIEKMDIIDAISYSGQKVWDGSYTTLISLGKLVTGQLSMKTISGPLAIADYSGKSAKIGLYAYISVMAAISIAVGVFNLLPIPMLDGGLLVQYAIESIRKKDLTEEILKKLQFVGVSILGSMFFIAMFNDIIKYVVL